MNLISGLINTLKLKQRKGFETEFQLPAKSNNSQSTITVSQESGNKDLRTTRSAPQLLPPGFPRQNKINNKRQTMLPFIIKVIHQLLLLFYCPIFQHLFMPFDFIKFVIIKSEKFISFSYLTSFLIIVFSFDNYIFSLILHFS